MPPVPGAAIGSGIGRDHFADQRIQLSDHELGLDIAPYLEIPYLKPVTRETVVELDTYRVRNHAPGLHDHPALERISRPGKTYPGIPNNSICCVPSPVANNASINRG